MKSVVRWLAAAVVIMGMLFAGNRIIPQSRAVQPAAETEPQAAEPILQTAAPAVLPEVLPQTLRCEAYAGQMDGEHIFVYDPAVGAMVYCSTEPTERVYPASITKLFSAWVALRFLPGDRVVRVGWELGMLEPGSSSAFLALDSRLTVEDLIRGMLLPSGNDAALVLAAAAGKEIAGDQKITAREAVTAFVAEMNREAQELGLQNTHFENPHGWHGENHYSCPADLGVIASLALEEPLIRRTMGLAQTRVTITSGETHIWTNTNRLVKPDSPQYCPEAIGMKTGYTEAAGYCLLAAFGESNPLVVGIFGSSDSTARYADAAALYRAYLAE